MSADPSTSKAPAFTMVRDIAVAIGRGALVLDLETIDQALAEADHAQAVGPILDPTLARDAGAELQQQVRFLRAFRTFRAVLEEFKPTALDGSDR